MEKWRRRIVWAVWLSLFVVWAPRVYAMDDKAKHAVAGTAIYGLCVLAGKTMEVSWLDYKTCLLPVAAAAVGKEVYDAATGGDEELADVGATLAVPVAAAGVTWVLFEW